MPKGQGYMKGSSNKSKHRGNDKYNPPASKVTGKKSNLKKMSKKK